MAYRKEEKMSHRRRNMIIVLTAIALITVGGIWYLYRQFQIQTAPVIQNSAGRSYQMEIPQSETRHFDQGIFSFDLPSDWKMTEHATQPYNIYSYQATLKNADNRYLEIYVDSLPQTMPVNQALAVKAQGNILSHGQVSDNCTAFMNGASTGTKQLAVPAKWDGVEFLCDNDSKTRRVTGTSSSGGINKVVLTGQTSGQHAFFFVYTDHNNTPEYTIFYDMLESFKLK